MYQSIVLTKEQAVAHLFFHCCFRDELATEAETDAIAEKIVLLKLQADLNLKDEVRKYKSYQASITSDEEYVQYLIGLMSVTNKNALYSYCVELCLTDLVLQEAEEKLLGTIASSLQVSEIERPIINNLIVQRKIVEGGSLF